MFLFIKKNLSEKEVNYKYHSLMKIIDCYHNYGSIMAHTHIYKYFCI